MRELDLGATGDVMRKKLLNDARVQQSLETAAHMVPYL